MRMSQNTDLAKPPLPAGPAGRLGPYLNGRRGLMILGGVVLTLGVSLNWSWLAAAGITPILVGLLPCAAMCVLGLCLPRLMRPNADQQAAPLDMSSNRVPASCTDLPSIIRASADGDCCTHATPRPSKDSE
jgi:hypothetical protein